MNIIKRLFVAILVLLVLTNNIISLATEEIEDENLIDNIDGEEIIEGEIDPNIIQPDEYGLIIYSETAVMIEASTGKILYEKNKDQRMYPASTTKILTAILAIENCSLDEEVLITESAIKSLKSGYTKADVKVGETFTMEQMIEVMMLQSANEVAVAIAEHISGSVEEFSKLMNAKATEIGCTNSNFINPNGMHDENHYSSAYDLALIAQYAMKNETFRKIAVLDKVEIPISEIYSEDYIRGVKEEREKERERIIKRNKKKKNKEPLPDENAEIIVPNRVFYNTNQMFNKDSEYYYSGCLGIKAGFTTPAKNCLVSGALKDGFEVITVILHAETTQEGKSARYCDTITLFNYAFENYNINDIRKEYYLEPVELEKTLHEVTAENIVRRIENEIKETIDGVDNKMYILLIGAGIFLFLLGIILLIIINRKKKYNKTVGRRGF